MVIIAAMAWTHMVTGKVINGVYASVANVILDMPKLTGSCLSDTGIG